MITEVLVVNRALVASILAPFAAMEVVAGLFAWIYFRRQATSRSEAGGVGQQVAIKNPFSLTAAAKFAAFFAAVLLVVKLAQRSLPAESLYVVAALAGLSDVDAIAFPWRNTRRAAMPAWR